MKLKLQYRRLLYRLCEGTFFFFYTLARLLPLSSFRKVARPLLQLFILLVVPKRRIIRNLTAAFGQSYSAATKSGIARGVQTHFVENLLDCLTQLIKRDYARQAIDIEGIENLEVALKKGKGVIALGAHIGNFVLLGTRIGLEGYRFHTLFRIPADDGVKRIIARYLPSYHQSVIPSLPRRTAVRKILEALKRNEIVYILGDNLKKGRIDALLFGQHVPSPRGPISLALRSGAPIVPIYLIRHYHGRMRLVIEPEIELARGINLAAAVAENTRFVVGYLESLIRCYPDQWNWLTVKMTEYQRDFADPTASDNLPLEEAQEEKKDGAGEEDRTPDLMLGKHTL